MTSPFGSLAVIADPAAGQGRVGERLPELRKALEATDLEYDLRVTDSPGAGERFATTALDDGFRYVVAVGDDATVQGVVNGLFRDGLADRRDTGARGDRRRHPQRPAAQLRDARATLTAGCATCSGRTPTPST